MSDAAAPWATDRAVKAVATFLAKDRGGAPEEWTDTAEAILRLPAVSRAITVVCARLTDEAQRAVGNLVLTSLGQAPLTEQQWATPAKPRG